MEDEPPTEQESDGKYNSTSLLEKKTIDGNTIMSITQLIGLGEAQRRIYDALRLEKRPDLLNSDLGEVYRLHQQELELLIKYQKENNGG